MIVDAHFHQTLFMDEEVFENRAKYMLHAAKSMGRVIDLEAIKKQTLEAGPDPDGEQLIESMDRDGIDVRVILTVDNIDGGKPPEVFRDIAGQLGKIVSRYPKRVIALVGIDPRRPEAPDIMKEAFEKHGISGLKYHPDSGYEPCSPESYRLLEVVNDNKGILLSHTSPLMPPARNALAEPMLLSDIGVDYPDIRVIAAHMGALNWRSWASLAHMQPNFYGDLAMWDAFAVSNYRLFRREFRDLLDYAGVDKVLFGSDAPVLSPVFPVRDWIQIIKDLPRQFYDGIVFTQAEVDAILGGNAVALFGLSGA